MKLRVETYFDANVSYLVLFLDIWGLRRSAPQSGRPRPGLSPPLKSVWTSAQQDSQSRDTYIVHTVSYNYC